VQAEAAMAADPKHQLHIGLVPGFPGVFGRMLQFQGRWYARISAPLGWEDAELVAQRLGGHHGTVRDKETEDFLIRNLLDRTHPGTWLGGFRPGKDKPWQWASGAPWGFEDWGPGKPAQGGSSAKGFENRLVYQVAKAGAPMSWRDTFATLLQDSFLVEWEN
jgi:hypothetical protein